MGGLDSVLQYKLANSNPQQLAKEAVRVILNAII